METGTKIRQQLAHGWADQREAPARVLAANSTAGKVDRAQLLCPYPQVARYNGAGSIDERSNFTCRLPHYTAEDPADSALRDQ